MGFWQDVHYALRGTRRSPGFTAVTVLSLALGIGANTAIFSLINTLTLRLLPVHEPQQLVEFLAQYPGEPPLNVFSRESYEYFRDSSHVFAGLTGKDPARFVVRSEGVQPETVAGEYVLGNFFPMLGVKPAIGRLIGPGDEAVAVVSWSYWKNKFNLDPSILGKHIVVADTLVTVVGVAPPEFFGLQVGVRPEIWMPLPSGRAGLGPLQLIARLKPGISAQQARAEMAVLFRWTLEERTRNSKDPVMRQLKFSVEPVGAGLSTELRGRFVNPLLALMALVALLLLVACTNVANMALARGAGRQREMAVRVALGAGRLRLVRQVLTESLLLSAAGGAIGVLLAYLGDGVLVRMIQSGRPIVGMPAHLEIPVRPDMHVLLFTSGIALLTALLFGLAPAWTAFASAAASSLRAAGRAGETRFRRLLGKSLVVAQVALSVGLLSVAGLFIANLSDLQHVDLGFRRDHVLLMTLDTPPGTSGAYLELLRHLETIPGVRSATISGPGPLSGAGDSRFVNVEGHPERPQDRRYVSVNTVGPKYFETLGIPLLMGREFTFEDRNSPRVAIINEAMARYYFRGVNPIGKYASFDRDQQPYRIVGVSGNANYYEIRETAPRIVYLNAFQTSRPGLGFALRTNIDPEAVESAVRRTVNADLKTARVARVITLADQIEATIVPERLVATLSGVFGGLGALLAAIGIYGVLAYTVTRRINEIGIRMALGATQKAVYRMMLAEALGMTFAGGLIGIAMACLGNRLGANMIHNLPVGRALPIAFGVVAMIAIALLAAYLPARRAARVDPVEALRHE